ncbi:MAG: mucin desulfatase [Chloroflexi bacterium HGW-Chloroflexi-10]|nr:MAG: mucin desulfatase [Chloroflexi bacterium HGW-Chloroflexi-10]
MEAMPVHHPTSILPFFLETSAFQVEKLAGGHIHDTWKVSIEHVPRYILQRINTNIFIDPQRLMDNIYRVTSHLQQHYPQHTNLRLLPTLSGQTCYSNQSETWRMFHYIPNSFTNSIPQNPDQVYEAGRITAQFTFQMAAFPPEALYVPLPDFHNTPKRYRDLQNAISQANPQRLARCSSELAWIKERAPRLGTLWDALTTSAIPWRVTHNDTKLDNVLFDRNTQRAICLIDLDTVMASSALFDYGDALRSMGNPAAEDEADLSKVQFQESIYEAYTQGYLSIAGNFLTPVEMKLLPTAPWIITIENGIRFLCDYLQGDRYYRISYPNQNLNRCRTQLKLAADIEFAFSF